MPVEVGVGCWAKKGVYSCCREIQYTRGTHPPPLVYFTRLLWRTFLHGAPPMSLREVCNCSRSSSAPAARRLFPPASAMTHKTLERLPCRDCTAAVCQKSNSQKFSNGNGGVLLLWTSKPSTGQPAAVTVCSRLKKTQREALSTSQLFELELAKPTFSGSCRQQSAGWVALPLVAAINWNG